MIFILRRSSSRDTFEDDSYLLLLLCRVFAPRRIERNIFDIVRMRWCLPSTSERLAVTCSFTFAAHMHFKAKTALEVPLVSWWAPKRFYALHLLASSEKNGGQRGRDFSHKVIVYVETGEPSFFSSSPLFSFLVVFFFRDPLPLVVRPTDEGAVLICVEIYTLLYNAYSLRCLYSLRVLFLDCICWSIWGLERLKISSLENSAITWIPEYLNSCC